MSDKTETIITFNGAKWRVLSLGVERGDETFAHLASVTHGRHQMNGFVHTQINVFVPTASIREAA